MLLTSGMQFWGVCMSLFEMRQLTRDNSLPPHCCASTLRYNL